MKTRKRKLNVRLLRRIQKHILEEPRRFWMDGLHIVGKVGTSFYSDNNTLQRFPSCGTAACIAGWALLLSGKQIMGLLSLGEAAQLLNLRDYKRLFLSVMWPEPFAANYQDAKTPAKRALIASARIEHLIKTGE